MEVLEKKEVKRLINILLDTHIKQTKSNLLKLMPDSNIYPHFKKKLDDLEKIKHSFNLYMK